MYKAIILGVLMAAVTGCVSPHLTTFYFRSEPQPDGTTKATVTVFRGETVDKITKTFKKGEDVVLEYSLTETKGIGISSKGIGSSSSAESVLK